MSSSSAVGVGTCVFNGHKGTKDPYVDGGGGDWWWRIWCVVMLGGELRMWCSCVGGEGRMRNSRGDSDDDGSGGTINK